MSKHSWKNPVRSKVTKGTEGKFITIMGSNSTGKTFQTTQPDKNGKEVYVLAFEEGLNALDGVNAKVDLQANSASKRCSQLL